MSSISSAQELSLPRLQHYLHSHQCVPWNVSVVCFHADKCYWSETLTHTWLTAKARQMIKLMNKLRFNQPINTICV